MCIIWLIILCCIEHIFLSFNAKIFLLLWTVWFSIDDYQIHGTRLDEFETQFYHCKTWQLWKSWLDTPRICYDNDNDWSPEHIVIINELQLSNSIAIDMCIEAHLPIRWSRTGCQFRYIDASVISPSLYLQRLARVQGLIKRIPTLWQLIIILSVKLD